MTHYKVTAERTARQTAWARSLQQRQWEMQEQVQAAQLRAEKAAQHRKSLGTKALKGLYVKMLAGDVLVDAMFGMKLQFGKYKAMRRVGQTIFKAWALHDMHVGIVEWSHKVQANKVYLQQRLERTRKARAAPRKYGDAVFKNFEPTEDVFPVTPPAPRWGGVSAYEGPIEWRLENGIIHRVLKVADEEVEPRGGISPPRRPGLEMLKGSYS